MSNEKLVLLALEPLSLPLPVNEFKSILYGFQMAPVDGPKSLSVNENLDFSPELSNMSL